jgi:hypothetical protein
MLSSRTISTITEPELRVRRRKPVSAKLGLLRRISAQIRVEVVVEQGACELRVGRRISGVASRIKRSMHAAFVAFRAEHSNRLSKACRYVANTLRDIGAPCPGINVANSIFSSRPSASRQRAEHAVSNSGAGNVTRSPDASTFDAGS